MVKVSLKLTLRRLLCNSYNDSFSGRLQRSYLPIYTCVCDWLWQVRWATSCVWLDVRHSHCLRLYRYV